MNYLYDWVAKVYLEELIKKIDSLSKEEVLELIRKYGKPMTTYSDECLARAARATEGPWKHPEPKSLSVNYEQDGKIAKTHAYGDAEFIAHARTDVPELARRLYKACDTLHNLAIGVPSLRTLLKELEAPLE